MGASAAVGERDGLFEERREPLLHVSRSWQDRRLRRVFNLSGSEIVVILLLALVVLGPEKLPDAIRRAGKTYAELKKMGNSFQSEMKSVLDEPMKEMRDTADLLKKSMDFTDGELGATKPATPPRVPTVPREVVAPAVDAPAIEAPVIDAAPTDEALAATDAADAAPTVDAPPDSVTPAADAAIVEVQDSVVDVPVVEDQPVLSAEDELINRTLSGER
jgi:sec-independent protein translocase protein TatB